MAKYKIIPSSRTIVQSPISIGHKAEKGVEAIEFDLTAWVETYGSGTLTVIMRRWGDAIPYPIALEIDENNKATWVLSDTDTARAGMAYAQLSYIVGETVVKKSDIYTFRVMDSLTGEGDPPEAYESWLEHLTHLAAEAMAEVLDIEGIVTDKTLTVDGGIADAKKTGDELSALKADLEDLDERVEVLESGSGLTDAVKTALLQLAQKVAYIDDGGQDYYDDLYYALYAITAITLNTNSISMQTIGATSQLTATTTPAGGNVTWSSSNTSVATVSSTGLVTSVAYGSATITATAGSVSATCGVVVAQATCTGITASYTQSGTVYDNASLDDLKADLVVTASWSNGTTSTLNDADYTLSGTLAEGTSTITVAYGGKTTTFTVMVSESEIYTYSYANGDLTKLVGTCGYAQNVGAYYKDSTDNKRRAFLSPSGENPLLFYDGQNNYVPGEYYPIPIPSDATSVAISITPNANNIGPAFYTHDEVTGIYTRVYDPGWVQGSNTYTFTAGEYDALTVTSKTRFGAAFTESDEPTELTIVFE